MKTKNSFLDFFTMGFSCLIFVTPLFAAHAQFTEQHSLLGFDIGLQIDGGSPLLGNRFRAPVLPVIAFSNDQPRVINPLQGFALLDQGQIIPWSDAKPLVSQALLADKRLINGYPNQQLGYVDLPGGGIFAVPEVFKTHIEQPLFKNFYLLDFENRAKLYQGVFLAVLGNERVKDRLQGANPFNEAIDIADGIIESVDGLTGIDQEAIVAIRSMQGIKLAQQFGQQDVSRIPWKVSTRVDKALSNTGLGKTLQKVKLISLALNTYNSGMDAAARSYLLATAIEDTRTQATIDELLFVLKSDSAADPAMIAGLELAQQQMLKFSEAKISRVADAMWRAAKEGAVGAGLIAIASKSGPVGFVLSEAWSLKGEVDDLQIGLLAGLVNVDRFLFGRIDALMTDGQLGRLSANQVNVPNLLRFQHLLGFTTIDTLYAALWEGRWAVSLSGIEKGLIFTVKDWFNSGLKQDIHALREQHFDLLKKDHLLDVHRTSLLEQLRQRYLSPAPTQGANAQSRIVAIVDSSGSMGQTDPKNLRIEALKMMLDSLGDNVELAIIDFDNKVSTIMAPKRLGPIGGEVRESAKKALRRIDSDGGTEIAKGLQKAYQLTERAQDETVFVLMSDGKDANWRGQANFLSEHIKVHTIALSEQADQEALGRVSAATGGIAEIARDATDLHRIFANLFGEAEGQEVMLVRSGILKTGERVQFDLPVESSLSGLDFQVTLPGSDIDLTIVDPYGRRITIDEAVRNGFGVEQKTYDIIRVARPSAGRWQAVLDGIDLDPQGEPFTLRALAKGGTVKTRWVSNVAVPEVGESFSLSVDDQGQASWQSAEITLWRPDGSQHSESRTLGGLATLLGGAGNETVYTLTPERPGVYRVQIALSGVLPDGEPLLRTLDRSFRVAMPGKGLSYRHDIDPFIRRTPGMLE